MGKTQTAEGAVKRPEPPANLGQYPDGANWPVSFAPAPELKEWVIATFIAEDGRLHNPDHAHLEDADFEMLWAAAPFEKQGRIVLGQTEEVAFRAGGWQRERMQEQVGLWFGRIPDFIITIAASYCQEAADADFCALMEHELYHIGQQKDATGEPVFGREGQPKLQIRGHDVEEFVGVVARYGAGDESGNLARLVRAANSAPHLSALRVSQACGTCLLKLA